MIISYEDVIKWKHFPRYWPFVGGIHRSLVNPPHNGQWRTALMFPLICLSRIDWANTGDSGDLKHHHAHYDVSEMSTLVQVIAWCSQAASYYLNHFWPISLFPYGVTRPQLVKLTVRQLCHTETCNWKSQCFLCFVHNISGADLMYWEAFQAIPLLKNDKNMQIILIFYQINSAQQGLMVIHPIRCTWCSILWWSSYD